MQQASDMYIFDGGQSLFSIRTLESEMQKYKYVWTMLVLFLYITLINLFKILRCFVKKVSSDGISGFLGIFLGY